MFSDFHLSGSAVALAAPFLDGAVDTDALATCVWEERYLGSASVEVREVVRKPALYLLTGVDGVPFEDDGLRDGAHVREWMTRRLREEVAASGVPVVELDGPHPERLAVAVKAVDALLVAGWTFVDPLVAKRES